MESVDTQNLRDRSYNEISMVTRSRSLFIKEMPFWPSYCAFDVYYDSTVFDNYSTSSRALKPIKWVRIFLYCLLIVSIIVTYSFYYTERLHIYFLIFNLAVRKLCFDTKS